MALWSDEDIESRERAAAQGVAARARAARTAAKLLGLLAALLALAIVAGTVYALASGTRSRKLADEAEAAQAAAEMRGRASFTGVGTIRAKSADPRPAVVVATIAFPYDAGDGSFSEELSRKAPVLRAVATELLSSRKAAQLAPAFEGGLKAALRDAFNARLSLGKVTEIWLSDFAVVQ